MLLDLGRWILELVNFFALVIDLANAFNIAHIGNLSARNQVKVSQSIHSAPLTLVKHHLVLVNGGVSANQEDYVARLERASRIPIKVTVDHG